MGLDSFASRNPNEVELSPEDLTAFKAANSELCGGMYSGDEGSFRGKIYDDLIREVTGVSLYQEWIPPEEIQRLSEKLDAYSPEQLAAISTRVDGAIDASSAHNALECANLQAFFRVCAAQGLGLIGWW